MIRRDMKADFNTIRAFEKIVHELLRLPGVSYPSAELGRTRGFGSTALKVNGKIFAMINSQGRFAVKLPQQRVFELMADGRGARFEIGKARWVKEWVCLVPGTEDQWPAFAREALSFVEVTISADSIGSPKRRSKR